YLVETAKSGESALEKVNSGKPNLIILDLMLPGIDGLEVCRQLKSHSQTAHIPIVMLTAKGEDADIVTGLELGADDYVTKPFSPRILTARVKAVLRRNKTGVQEKQVVIQTSDIEINYMLRDVTVGGIPVSMTATEFNILFLLTNRPGWVFTRNQIINALRGDDYAVTERSIDVQIVGLRKKLGEAGKHIQTVRGIGYR
ncbi:MAG: response regulator, partial [Candidatus Latescibacterota bacterium]